MRLWTLHPKYLDAKGLVAVWREALLAQKVLTDQTKGYKNHPQLDRFKAQPDPVAAIATYLQGIYDESKRRDYNFDKRKIGPRHISYQIATARGQLIYEWKHLKRKLEIRDMDRFNALRHVEEPEVHPLFEIVDGDVEPWEVLLGEFTPR